MMHRADERLPVRSRYKRASLVIGDQLGVAAHGSSDHWQACGHCLENCIRYPFGERRLYEDIETAEQLVDVVAIARQPDAIFNSCRAHAFTNIAVQFAVPHYRKPRPFAFRVFIDESRECVDETGVILDRIHTSDGTDYAGRSGQDRTQSASHRERVVSRPESVRIDTVANPGYSRFGYTHSSDQIGQ